MNVYFLCPSCEAGGHSELQGSSTWQCPRCDHLLELREPQSTSSEKALRLHSCAVCGNEELYKKKGFPHWLGMMILVGACIAFLYYHGNLRPVLAWGILLGSAAIDGLLYLLVKDVVVCYRCHSVHRGIGKSDNQPFELTVQERYRQQAIRSKVEGQSSPKG